MVNGRERLLRRAIGVTKFVPGWSLCSLENFYLWIGLLYEYEPEQNKQASRKVPKQMGNQDETRKARNQLWNKQSIQRVGLSCCQAAAGSFPFHAYDARVGESSFCRRETGRYGDTRLV